MNKTETIKTLLQTATTTIATYNKKLVDFETNIMLFADANVIKNINELSLMQSSLTSTVTNLVNATKLNGCTLEQYCQDNDMSYELNEFSVQKHIMGDLLNSLEKTNDQINDCVGTMTKSHSTDTELPTSIRRRIHHAKLKKLK